MSDKRVVVTGMGTVNPLSHDVESTWKKVLSGECGIDRITAFDPSTFSSQVAGEVKDFNFENYYRDENVSKAKRMDPFVHYAQAAFIEARDQSGIDVERYSERIGISVGSGIGGMHVNRRQAETFFYKGHRRCSPFYIPTFIGNMAAGFLSIENQLKGPNVSLQTACATGNHSLAMAYFMIREGMADAMVSGATESIVEPLSIAGFANMRALSTKYNDNPKVSSRPFDRDRDGFVMGEGSAILILEEYEFAKKRGANILCELKAVGMSGDAYDIVLPCVDGDGAYRSMKMGLEKAQVDFDDIDYINCHGTSTPSGDMAEIQAVEKLLQLRNTSEKLWIGSTKSMSGHLIGAASAFEAVITVKSIKSNIVPPNINLFNLDEQINIGSMINREPVEQKINVAMSNSFGFGGHNSTVIFSDI